MSRIFVIDSSSVINYNFLDSMNVNNQDHLILVVNSDNKIKISDMKKIIEIGCSIKYEESVNSLNNTSLIFYLLGSLSSTLEDIILITNNVALHDSVNSICSQIKVSSSTTGKSNFNNEIIGDYDVDEVDIPNFRKAGSYNELNPNSEPSSNNASV